MGEKNKFSIILLVIIAALAIALASITVYVLVGGGSGTKQTEKAVQITKPADSEITTLAIFDKKAMNLKASDTKTSSTAVIEISAGLVYYNKVTGIKDTAAKVKTYDADIKELIGTYFQNMTLEDAKKPETKEKAKKELTKQINELLNANEKSKNDIIYNVNFSEWFYQ